eukprot:gnl/TRDRNA2_/TRDRNA2_84376_c0_seq1.p1 gnl/TRDRNA2_/TRDRNA2_84376_c0~~gnl/TRDRNA2_/TRDRNA2_84376_c0_seq1.p1  ORF type:complete len:262 (-),score=36.66 gnl/TRDRNA2_/TRDRNA2_84376_c0_seq1:152-937(-)
MHTTIAQRIYHAMAAKITLTPTSFYSKTCKDKYSMSTCRSSGWLPGPWCFFHASPSVSIASTRASSGVGGGIDSARTSPSLAPPVQSSTKERSHRRLQDEADANDSEESLVARLFALSIVQRRAHESLEFALSIRFAVSETEAKKGVSRVVRCVRLLKRCNYEWEDIKLVVAHAAVYLRQLIRQGTTRNMDLNELCYAICLIVFLAHSHIFDETCPLRCWHKHIFANYCSIGTLNKALMRLFANLSYKLRVDPDELKDVLL